MTYWFLEKETKLQIKLIRNITILPTIIYFINTILYINDQLKSYEYQYPRI